MAYEHVTSANDARLAPYARVRDADLAAWPAFPAGLFMAESRAVIAAVQDQRALVVRADQGRPLGGKRRCLARSVRMSGGSSRCAYNGAMRPVVNA